MKEKSAGDVCFYCKDATKIIDYVWDRDTNTYTNTIKCIGYLCDSKKFSRKYYRKSRNSIGLGCRCFVKNENEIKTIHNNTVFKKQK